MGEGGSRGERRRRGGCAGAVAGTRVAVRMGEEGGEGEERGEGENGGPQQWSFITPHEVASPWQLTWASRASIASTACDDC